jgi:hypothetical protein
VGTSQHTLLRNRIKALYISKLLIEGEDNAEKFSLAELSAALPPVTSIISKCEKAQQKFVEKTPSYSRLEKLIKAMEISKKLINGEIDERSVI